MQGHPPTTDQPPPSAEHLFEDAYRTAGTAVLGYALRRSDSREDALDLVAETFAVAWRRRIDMPVDPEEVRPWLFGIARRCLANALRSTQRAGRLGARLAESLADASVPDPSALHEERAETRLVHEALGQLPPDDRELVTLIAWEGCRARGSRPLHPRHRPASARNGGARRATAGRPRTATAAVPHPQAGRHASARRRGRPRQGGRRRPRTARGGSGRPAAVHGCRGTGLELRLLVAHRTPA
jgi:RNA polymerase sigma factor (sigma-70 family)